METIARNRLHVLYVMSEWIFTDHEKASYNLLFYFLPCNLHDCIQTQLHRIIMWDIAKYCMQWLSNFMIAFIFMVGDIVYTVVASNITVE